MANTTPLDPGQQLLAAVDQLLAIYPLASTPIGVTRTVDGPDLSRPDLRADHGRHVEEVKGIPVEFVRASLPQAKGLAVEGWAYLGPLYVMQFLLDGRDSANLEQYLKSELKPLCRDLRVQSIDGERVLISTFFAAAPTA